MTNKPRRHHFIPQFWIRRFQSPDGKLWSYDKNTDRIGDRSSRQLMQIMNLYTVQPNGADDTTLETVDLNKIDAQGSATFDRIINGGDRSQAAKEALASYLAVQILRDPDVVASFAPRAQELTMSLLETFDAPDFASFRGRWEESFPGASITEAEFNHIKSLGLQDAEDALEQIILALVSQGGVPELPFTDVVKNPDGRNIVRDRLLTFNWTVKTDAAGRFILGDAGVLYNKGDMSDLRAALSRDVALYLTPTDAPALGISSTIAPEHDIQNLNLENAARARRWIVGDKQELDRLKSQVGSQSLPDPNNS
ncbi:DUF4238 domain-containing protein [Bradyrhizobium manausense]|uniref:DUF4238 domain-containing protein n=1 Tax=Bradyrhizobium manausense TaxID=989370 RepID=A0A0R3E6R9_9BRAD|nr:DUF4238 domain-containing protein [Bradyrhizobium manausense]KRQ15780.1 hypothetical protein AOQ71_07745 [Bradyrhizobium manausense]